MKIDLVYLWVDGNDPSWIKKKAQHDGSLNLSNKELSSECRYTENDELKYSLRSAEKYAPWINNIYIITDNQTPSWLDTSNPRIKIIDHKDILPERALPTFNSTIIELGIANIPSLSEHFIYSNDDTLFNKPTEPSFFFTKEGKVINRFTKKNMMYYKSGGKSQYTQLMYSSIKKIQNDFGTLYNIKPHHNIDGYSKSTYTECLDKYKDWVNRSYHCKFRTNKEINKVIVSLYSIATNTGELKLVNRYNGSNSFFDKLKCIITRSSCFDSKNISIHRKDYNDIIKRNNPTLICMNDNENATNQDRQRAKEFLNNMFPDKSSFEK